jgi:hypothetical protein
MAGLGPVYRPEIYQHQSHASQVSHASQASRVSTPPVHQSTNLFARLHALFPPGNTSTHDVDVDTDSLMFRAKTEPSAVYKEPTPPPAVPQREAIKVLIITWNMGDALVGLDGWVRLLLTRAA